jgi:hypothetical protein
MRLCLFGAVFRSHPAEGTHNNQSINQAQPLLVLTFPKPILPGYIAIFYPRYAK